MSPFAEDLPATEEAAPETPPAKEPEAPKVKRYRMTRKSEPVILEVEENGSIKEYEIILMELEGSDRKTFTNMVGPDRMTFDNKGKFKGMKPMPDVETWLLQNGLFVKGENGNLRKVSPAFVSAIPGHVRGELMEAISKMSNLGMTEDDQKRMFEEAKND